MGIASFADEASLDSTGVEGDGKRQLGNVLKAIALHAKDVGYCQVLLRLISWLTGLALDEAFAVCAVIWQGMNYVGAVLLLLMTSAQETAECDLGELSAQEAAFWLTLALIRHKGMAELWRGNMPGLSLSLVLNVLCRLQWFVTLFARVVPLPTLERVWDLFLLDGWKAIYRVALAITAQLRPLLLTMVKHILWRKGEYFRKNPKLGLDALSTEQLLAHALQYKVTRSILKRLEEERHLEQTPLSHEHRMLFPALDRDDDAAAQCVSLNFIRSQLQHFDTDVASDTVFLQRKIEAAERAQAQALSARYAATYTLSEATFDLNERSELRLRLRAQIRELQAIAIAEASASSASSDSSPVLPTWTTPVEFFNSRVLSCFERLPLASSRNGEAPGSFDDGVEGLDDEDEEQRELRRNLVHLEVLVPHLAADLRVIQRKLVDNEQELRSLRQRLRGLQHDAQLARVEVEEAQQFKDRLADQLLQILLASEKLKNTRMQQLFAEVDEVVELRG
ncbi:hypothetical protein BBJ28_00008677 [Nothophytophthora sp. Chile5]|nr:hypothetical protein BBJ28_00008677 [Nothophytophthora sp. Chile5]